MDTTFSCAKYNFRLDDRDKASSLQGMQIKRTQPLAVQKQHLKNNTSLWMTATSPTLYRVCSLNGHNL